MSKTFILFFEENEMVNAYSVFLSSFALWNLCNFHTNKLTLWHTYGFWRCSFPDAIHLAVIGWNGLTFLTQEPLVVLYSKFTAFWFTYFLYQSFRGSGAIFSRKWSLFGHLFLWVEHTFVRYLQIVWNH